MLDCHKREKDLKEQAKHYQTTPSSDDSELLKQFVNFMNEFKKQNGQNGVAHNATERLKITITNRDTWPPLP